MQTIKLGICYPNSQHSVLLLVTVNLIVILNLLHNSKSNILNSQKLVSWKKIGISSKTKRYGCKNTFQIIKHYINITDDD